MSVQLVHCSDMHLDKNFNISNLARAQERKDDLNNNFSAAVEYALKNKPDLFLITGDVFDRNSPSNSARVFVTEKVRQLREAGIRVFLIGGNHDVPKFGGQHLAIDVLASAGLATVFSKSDAIEASNRQSSQSLLDKQSSNHSPHSNLQTVLQSKSRMEASPFHQIGPDLTL